MNLDHFRNEFGQLTGNSPFPWQAKLYERFIAGSIPSRCDIPTGLGKTSVIAIWLLAREVCPPLPRRLVYVVNRRTVVDQTTNEVERYKLLRPDLAVSTLRGQFADNREWSADPSRTAVICGTVDMIGSRLLFSGYGVGFKGKPLHAGFLGQDSLIVHDEAHLEPAFQDLLMAIQREQREGRFPDRHPLRVMELSATSRGKGNDLEATQPFKLTPADHENEVVKQRIHANKKLHLIPQTEPKPGNQLAKIAIDKFKDSGKAVLIFTRTIDDVKAIVDALDKAKLPCAQLIGPMRGLERDRLTNPRDEKGSSIFARFLPPPKTDAPENERWKISPAEGTVYLVCTSAGEVGVNISADHLVCDLSTFESMAQRFGRVNRFGESENTPPEKRRNTQMYIVHPADADFDDKDKLTPTRKKTLNLLRKLDGNASPYALSELDPASRADAFAPLPVILPTSEILFDAWSLTSIRDRMPGRPPVEPYLHGISDWEPPQTTVAWRLEVSEIVDGLLNDYPAADLLESYPLKPHELLADRTDRIFKTLTNLKPDIDVPIWIVDDENHVSVTTLSKISAGDKDEIAGVTLLLAPNAGGLDKGNFSGAKYDLQAPYDVADEWLDKAGPMRCRVWQEADAPAPRTPRGMKPVQRIAFPDKESEDAKPRKVWHWFVRVLAADADARSSQPYDLLQHLNDAKAACSGFVTGLSLGPEVSDAVVLAAQYHDLGKDRERWQNGIGNDRYPQVKWAKSGKRARSGDLTSYRHEFGSILDLYDEKAFKNLTPDMQDLVLHLIAAHHGRGRPHFTADESIDDNHDTRAVDAIAIETPRRFSRLQRKYGRWGLAYLESLVRAADYAASVKAEGEKA